MRVPTWGGMNLGVWWRPELVVVCAVFDGELMVRMMVWNDVNFVECCESLWNVV